MLGAPLYYSQSFLEMYEYFHFLHSSCARVSEKLYFKSYMDNSRFGNFFAPSIFHLKSKVYTFLWCSKPSKSTHDPDGCTVFECWMAWNIHDISSYFVKFITLKYYANIWVTVILYWIWVVTHRKHTWYMMEV